MASKIKYNLDMLINFCKDNNIILDSIPNNINCNTKITSKCIREDCFNNYEKKFHILFKTNNFFCKKCSINNGFIKQKQTVQNKYGVDSVFKSDKIKETIKNTFIKKYGVDNPSKNEKFKDKMIETKMQKYNIKLKKILSQEEKINELIEKYGTVNFRNSNIIKDKIKNTCIEKYGVDHISKLDKIKQIKKTNSLQKYGCEFPIQFPEIAEKTSKSRFKQKVFEFPSGRKIFVQGYEPFALKDLVEKEKIEEDDILVGCRNVPEIWYFDKLGKKHRHYVDIYIPSQNRCIEIKSSWTVKKENVFVKKTAAELLGFKYEILVYNQKGILIETF
jgi:hypothetical protein